MFPSGRCFLSLMVAVFLFCPSTPCLLPFLDVVSLSSQHTVSPVSNVCLYSSILFQWTPSPAYCEYCSVSSLPAFPVHHGSCLIGVQCLCWIPVQYVSCLFGVQCLCSIPVHHVSRLLGVQCLCSIPAVSPLSQGCNVSVPSQCNMSPVSWGRSVSVPSQCTMSPVS